MNRLLKLAAAIVSTTPVLVHSGTALATNWSSQNLGGTAAIVQADAHAGYLDLYAMDRNSPWSISFRTFSPGIVAPGSWSAWQNVGNPPPGSATMCSADSVWGNHGQIWTTGFDGNAWTFSLVNNAPDSGGWQSIGAPAAGIAGCVHTVSWDTGRLDVFVRGWDNALWHTWFDNGWGWWESLGGQIVSDPVPVSSAPGQLDVFVLATNNELWDLKWNGPDHPNSWWWWGLGINTGGHSNAPPMGAKSGTGSTLGVALGSGLQGREYFGSPPWTAITTVPGGTAAFNYSSLYRSGNRVDTFFFAPWDGTIKNFKYDHASGWSGPFSTADWGFDWGAWPVAVNAGGAAHVFVTKPNGNVSYLKGLGL